jgi:predicted transcriptional regulator
MEEPKRLAPVKEVLRDLYLLSGNQCAFPGCTRTILNDKGNLVGQVCHIEAAMQGGERFNPNRTNEERRAFSNLMLLCYDHHIETNDVEKYTVKRLKKMKQDHEKKYSDAAEKLLVSTVSDMTLLQEYEYCSTLSNINKVLNWGNNEDELSKVVPLFNDLVERLRKLAPNTRNIFSIMVARAHGSEIDLNEIIEVTGRPQSEIVNAVALLEKYGLITEPEKNEYLLPVSYYQQYEMWDMWSAIKEYSELSSISLDEIITNMRFSLLD